MNNRPHHLPNLRGLCKESLNPTVISVSDQQCAFSPSVESQSIFVSAIYASTAYLKRRKLWSEILDLHSGNLGPWCMIGDYNVILGSNEVRGSFFAPSGLL